MGTHRHTHAHPAVAALLTAATVLLAGCGNYVNVEIIGASGFSHDAEGNLTVHVNTCNEEISSLEVAADREGLSEPEDRNEVLARYTIDAPQSGHVAVRLDDPAPWRAEIPFDTTYPDRRMLLLNPVPDDRGGRGLLRPEKYLQGATPTREQILAAPAGAVVSGGGSDNPVTVRSPEEFEAVCAQ